MVTRRALLRKTLWLPPVLLFGAGCTGAVSGIKASFDHGLVSLVGGTMSFTLTVTSSLNAPDPMSNGTKTSGADVFIDLDDGLTLLDPQWSPTRFAAHRTAYISQTSFKAKVPRTYAFRIRLDKTGDFRVGAGARVFLGGSPESAGGLAGDSQAFYLRVKTGGTLIQRAPFKA